MSISRFIAVLLLAFPFLGCSQSGNYKSPDECYDIMLSAAKTKDYAILLSCYTLADRNQQVGWVAFHVERQVFFETEKRDAALALLTKNGLEKRDIMGLLQIYSSPGGKGAARAIELVGAEIRNQSLFMKEATTLLSPANDASNSDDAAPQPLLSDVIINGDNASGTLTIPNSEESTPIFFKKVESSWLITSDPVKNDSQ